METRFERKWQLPMNTFHSLKNALLISDFKFEKQYEPRSVNSIYFDDMFHSSIYQNLDGNNKKQKNRLRWYGEKNLILKPVFEIKKKNGFIVTKSKFKLELTELKLNAYSIKKLIFELRKKFPLLTGLSPISTTHYFRHYYISKNKNIRATIDVNVCYKKIKNFMISTKYKIENRIILELKYNTDQDNFVRKTFSQNNSLRLSRNSKFINSIFDI